MNVCVCVRLYCSVCVLWHNLGLKFYVAVFALPFLSPQCAVRCAAQATTTTTKKFSQSVNQSVFFYFCCCLGAYFFFCFCPLSVFLASQPSSGSSRGSDSNSNSDVNANADASLGYEILLLATIICLRIGVALSSLDCRSAAQPVQLQIQAKRDKKRQEKTRKDKTQHDHRSGERVSVCVCCARNR